MNADTMLWLGDVIFSRYEVPEKIAFGGNQALAVHELVGGARIVDAMGRRDMPIEWHGVFIGENALDRARLLNNMRIAGKPLMLTWLEFKYNVVIEKFEADFERFYKLPYSISCVVIEDKTNPVTTNDVLGFDETINADLAAADAYVATVVATTPDTQLSRSMASLDAAIASVSSMAKATQSQINSILTPLAMVQARVKILIGSTGNLLQNITTLGGILPNNPIANQVAAITSQVNASLALPQLYNLQAVLGRMGGNLGSLSSTGKVLNVAGGDLYHIAATQYGDASAWTTIANANKLTDPVISGVATLKIPAASDGLNGVLNA